MIYRLRLFLFFTAGFTISLAANLDKVSENTKCTAEISGQTATFPVGEIWNSSDPCIKFICVIDQTGKARPEPIKTECRQICGRGYEMQTIPDQCCGFCVKIKCFHEDKIYSIGDTWHEQDACMLYECVLENNTAVISAFKRTCPDLANCPAEDIYTEDCCQYCRDGKTMKIDNSRRQSMETYNQHPCKRKCIAGDEPMVCEYKFEVEWYETLSKACYDCPSNITDCTRPHCIAGDGFRRSVLVVNRKMPGPAIEVCLNDTLIVDVSNSLIGDSTTIHWHGLHQKDTPYMDGVPNLTQCPIIPYTTFRYAFQADNPGTHFWHSHVGLQRGDGCFGALIIRRPDDPHSKLFDFDLTEHILIKQDWIHTSGITMFTSHYHSMGDNKPVNILVNGKGRYLNPSTVKVDPIEEITTESDTERTPYNENDTSSQTAPVSRMMILPDDNHQNITNELNSISFEIFNVTKGSRYRFRTINSGFLNCPIIMSVDNHTMLVIQSDGYDLEPIEVQSFVTYAGERFDFVLNANQEIANYWIRFKGVMDCDERFGNVHQVAILRYNGASDIEPSEPTDYDYPVDGLQLNPLNKGPGQVDSLTISELSALDKDEDWVGRKDADYKFYLYFDFYNADHSLFFHPPFYGFENVSKKVYTPQLNGISLKMPPLPLLPARDQVDESTFCNETSLKEQGIDCKQKFCECHHVLKVPLNAIVELVLVDEGHTFNANHPFHLHGHAFRVIGMDRVGEEVTIDQIRNMDNSGLLKRNLKSPPIKDTVTVPDGGYSIIRFKADNPGYWLFHCHIEFHAEIGMALIFKVGENSQMVPVPRNFPTCSNYMPNITTSNEASHSAGFRIEYETLLTTLGLSLIVIYLLKISF